MAEYLEQLQEACGSDRRLVVGSTAAQLWSGLLVPSFTVANANTCRAAVLHAHKVSVSMSCTVWTDEQFDEMSWHDNHVHALRIVEGDYGAGELHLDLDYISKWLRGDDGRSQFKIVPAVLRFIDVTSLKVTLDYATPSAGLVPFSIHAIRREYQQRERYVAQCWTIDINWPDGEISFEASGFRQRAIGKAQISNDQYLAANER